MDSNLKFYLEEISNNSDLIKIQLIELIKEKLTKPSADFFNTEPGKEFLKRIQKKLIQKAIGFDNRATPLNPDFPTSKEAEEALAHKDEIITFLRDEVGMEISQWYQNMGPMKNSTFVIMECL